MPSIKSILLVDDDKVNNYINCRLMKRLQIAEKINVIENGREAIDYLLELNKNGQGFPDVILLDIHMPVMDGYEFLEALQKLSLKEAEKSKVVVLTTSNNVKDIAKMKKLGINSFLVKPLLEEHLVSFIESTIVNR
jgi:CheY-like chemotaxis protein